MYLKARSLEERTGVVEELVISYLRYKTLHSVDSFLSLSAGSQK